MHLLRGCSTRHKSVGPCRAAQLHKAGQMMLTGPEQLLPTQATFQAQLQFSPNHPPAYHLPAANHVFTAADAGQAHAFKLETNNRFSAASPGMQANKLLLTRH
jgi:hypothetical protein